MELYFVERLAAAQAIYERNLDPVAAAAAAVEADTARQLSDDADKDDTTPVPDTAFQPMPDRLGDFSFMLSLAGVTDLIRRTLVERFLALEQKAATTQSRRATAAELKKLSQKKRQREERKTSESSMEWDSDEDVDAARKRRVTTDDQDFANDRNYDDLTPDEIGAIVNRYTVTTERIGTCAKLVLDTVKTASFKAWEERLSSWTMETVYQLLEEELQRYYFQIRHDADPINIDDASALNLGIPKPAYLFQKMAHFSLDRLCKMADKGQDGDGFLYSNNKDEYPFIYKRGPAIWVPDTISLFLYEIGRSLTQFTRHGSDWIGQRVDEGMISVCKFTLVGTVAVQAVTNPGTGTGQGGGEFRTDRPTEFTYKWFYENPPGWGVSEAALIAACGLVPEWKCLSADERPAGYDRVLTAYPGFIYWRKWIKAKRVIKKNRPKTTLPLPALQGPEFRRFDKQEMLTEFPKDNFARKKMKGEWDAARLERSSVKLRRQPPRDTSAGSVMGKALVAAGMPGAGPSATTVVTTAVAWDGKPVPPPSTAAEFWQRFSQEVTVRQDLEVDEEAIRRALRTDQEWCHLQGHGDGGQEVLENFVSGSEHANSEQLAIESSQRPWFNTANLSARITAYLMPASPIVRSSLTSVEKNSLLTAGFVKADFAQFANFKATYEPLLAAFANDAGSKGQSTLAEAAAKAAREQAFAAGLPPPVRAKYEASTTRSRWLKKLHEDMSPMLNLPPPIAFAVRYKIYVQLLPHQPVKAFDHLIQMQRESFDLIEYRLLFWTVQMAIARRIDQQSIADPSGATGSSLTAAPTEVQKLLIEMAAKKTPRTHELPPANSGSSGSTGSASAKPASPGGGAGQ